MTLRSGLSLVWTSSPRTKVFNWIFQCDSFGYSHTIFGDLWSTEALTCNESAGCGEVRCGERTDDDGPSLRSKRSANSFRKHINAPQHPLSRIIPKDHILRCVSSLGDGRRLKQARRTRKSSSRAKDDVHGVMKLERALIEILPGWRG